MDYGNDFEISEPAQNSQAVKEYAEEFRREYKLVALERREKLLEKEDEAKERFMKFQQEADNLSETEDVGHIDFTSKPTTRGRKKKGGSSLVKRQHTEQKETSSAYQKVAADLRILRVDSARLRNRISQSYASDLDVVPFLMGEMPDNLPRIKKTADLSRLTTPQMNTYCAGYGLKNATKNQLADFLNIKYHYSLE